MRYEKGDALPYEWSGEKPPGFVEPGTVALIDDGFIQLYAKWTGDSWSVGYDRDGNDITLGFTTEDIERIRIVEIFEQK